MVAVEVILSVLSVQPRSEIECPDSGFKLVVDRDALRGSQRGAELVGPSFAGGGVVGPWVDMCATKTSSGRYFIQLGISARAELRALPESYPPGSAFREIIAKRVKTKAASFFIGKCFPQR